MDVVVIAESELEQAGVATEARDGDTAVRDLKQRHVDLVRLGLEQLGQVARMLSERVNCAKVCRRTAGQIKRLVHNAVFEGRLRPDALTTELRQKL